MVIDMSQYRKARQQGSQSLVIADRQYKVSAISSKLDQDIAFLEDRLDRIDRSKNPNQVIRKTYLSMLESRLSVKEWLSQYDHDQEQQAM